MSHVSKSCHTCKWVTCLSHATHVNESRVAREWITSENITEFVICSLLSSCIVRYWVRECITSASLWMHHVRLVSKCGTRRVTHIYESCHVTHMNTSLLSSWMHHVILLVNASRQSRVLLWNASRHTHIRVMSRDAYEHVIICMYVWIYAGYRAHTNRRVFRAQLFRGR